MKNIVLVALPLALGLSACSKTEETTVEPTATETAMTAEPMATDTAAPMATDTAAPMATDTATPAATDTATPAATETPM